jgi:tRNA(Ile)-lysidine synthase
LLQPQARFIVACSGGIDSVVLCELCHQAGLSFSIAHCNFGLRGGESDRDEVFVKSLGEKYSVPVFVKTFDTAQYGLLKKVSVQEAARELRYDWFESLRKEQGAAYVLLAHHANDNIETVLMHLFRGTGLHGLTGMPEQVDGAKCLRPLLRHTRTEIEGFAKEAGLQWVDDSSNASNKYTRNFFRNEVIPAIRNVYPQAEEAVLHTIERLKKTEALYQLMLHGLLKKLLFQDGDEIKVPVNKLLQYSDTSVPYELFKKFGFGEKQLPEILKLAGSESGSYLQNEQIRIIKHRNWFLISPVAAQQTTTFILEEGTKKIALPDGVLRVKKTDREHFHLDASPLVAQLDLREMQFPLLIRRWKQGDYFYPLGLRKKKKLARFFIDQKLSALDKEKIWVVESHSQIIWIIGYRIDDRVKVTDTTKTVLQLTLMKH